MFNSMCNILLSKLDALADLFFENLIPDFHKNMKNFNNETKRKIIEKYLKNQYEGIFDVIVNNSLDVYYARFNDVIDNYGFEISFSSTMYWFNVITIDPNLLGADVIEINKIVQDLKVIFKTLETMENLDL